MQPRQSLAPLRPLALPVLASVLLHAVLLWPGHPMRPAEAARRLPLSARLAPPQADPVPSAMDTAAEQPVRSAQGRLTAGSGGIAEGWRRSPVGAGPGTGPAAIEVVLPEGAARALRYALARELAAFDWPDMSGLSPTFTVAVHLRARRVVDVTLSGVSGLPAAEAALRSAFKTAAQKAVIPDSLPADGFSVELELEAGDPERPDHDRPHLPG